MLLSFVNIINWAAFTAFTKILFSRYLNIPHTGVVVFFYDQDLNVSLQYLRITAVTKMTVGEESRPAQAKSG